MDMHSMNHHKTCYPKSVCEYPLPAAGMTHELAQVAGQNLLVISQMDDSMLLKVAINPTDGKSAALLHLNFDSNPPDKLPRLFLLGSSITNPVALNAVLAVTLNNDYTSIHTQQTFVMPTQASKVHRVLPAFGGLYVSALTVSLLAHIPLQTSETETSVDEASDYYAMLGLGVDAQRIHYA